MKKLFWDYLSLIVLAGTVIGLDQWSKELVRTHLQVGEIWSPIAAMTPYLRIVHWKNSGAAFGMLQGFGGVFTILAIIVALVIIYYFPQIPSHDKMLKIALGLQLGGALGNLIDRLTQGYVTDFISVGSFPVFNIADSSITIGVIILALSVWLKDWRMNNETQAAKNESIPPSEPSVPTTQDKKSG